MLFDAMIIDEEPFMFDCGMDVVIENDLEDEIDAEEDMLSGDTIQEDAILDNIIDEEE